MLADVIEAKALRQVAEFPQPSRLLSQPFPRKQRKKDAMPDESPRVAVGLQQLLKPIRQPGLLEQRVKRPLQSLDLLGRKQRQCSLYQADIEVERQRSMDFRHGSKGSAHTAGGAGVWTGTK